MPPCKDLLNSALAVWSIFILLAGCAKPRPALQLAERHKQICEVDFKTVELTRKKLVADFGKGADIAEVEHPVLICGKDSGKPPVLLLHELPGLADKTLDYAVSLTQGDDGFTVYAPMLFGDLYQDSLVSGLFAYGFNGEWRQREQLGGSTLITQWLRALVSDIARRQPGHPLGVIGNCMTGAMPLALLDNPRVSAVVLAQPTLPMGTAFGLADARSLAISDREWNIALQRLNPPGNLRPMAASLSLLPLGEGGPQGRLRKRDRPVPEQNSWAAGPGGLSRSSEQSARSTLPPARAYGVRFQMDSLAPREKYEFLQQQLGTGFVGREIKSQEYVLPGKDANPACRIHAKAHSSLIYEWMDNERHPSEIRRREVNGFLRHPFAFEPNVSGPNVLPNTEISGKELPDCPSQQH